MATKPVRGTLVVDEDGLHLPGSVRGREGGFVLRTPAMTQDVRSLSPGQSVWPLVGAEDFQLDEDEAHNPSLCPDRVSLKVYGEDATLWTVNVRDGGSD